LLVLLESHGDQSRKVLFACPYSVPALENQKDVNLEFVVCLQAKVLIYEIRHIMLIHITVPDDAGRFKPGNFIFQFIEEPVVNRDLKPALLLFQNLLGENGGVQFSEQQLVFGDGCLRAEVLEQHDLCQSVVEEWAPGFDPVCHSRTIHFDQQIVRKRSEEHTSEL